MQILARFFVTLGVIFLVIGLLFFFFPSLGMFKIPGDIVIKNKNVVIVFPVVTSIVLSIVLTVIVSLIFRR